LEALQRKLAIPEGKMINYIADGGNTVSCTIPIAWAKAIEEHRFKNEDKVLLVGFGVGFSWCSALVTYQS
jgi:3-oxoacyl-[acyl-carrier-protein] synthase-3